MSNELFTCAKYYIGTHVWCRTAEKWGRFYFAEPRRERPHFMMALVKNSKVSVTFQCAQLSVSQQDRYTFSLVCLHVQLDGQLLVGTDHTVSDHVQQILEC